MTRAITDVEEIRRKFANRIAALAQLQSSALVEALARVPREDFVGPGPWKIMRPPFTGGYIDTPDADPVHLYDTVVVALDASRRLNNGEPSGLAAWLNVLDISRGMRFLHIGCGVGYYTAVVALAVSSQGAVLALEADAELAERARRNLAPYPNVEVRCATSPKPTDGDFDAIFVNAGATEILASWLDQLRERGASRAIMLLVADRTMSEIVDLHHIQLAIPAGQEDKARAFYSGVLGLIEETKPRNLAGRGGAWFRSGALRLHLGVDPDFHPARKAHPALLVRGLAELAARCEAAGFPPITDEPLEGFDRVYVQDPFGNRIELLERR